MSNSTQNRFSNDNKLQDAEQTLRLIAALPAPEGLEDRIHAGLRGAPRPARLLAWPPVFSPAGGWLRSAAAAAIVCVVAGGGWGIYSHVQPGRPSNGAASNGFGSAGVVRKPVTLNGPIVTQPASVVTPAPAIAAKGVAKTDAAKAAAAPVKVAKKAIATPGAPPVQ